MTWISPTEICESVDGTGQNNIVHWRHQTTITQKTTPVTTEETPVVALSLVQPTKKRQHTHTAYI